MCLTSRGGKVELAEEQQGPTHVRWELEGKGGEYTCAGLPDLLYAINYGIL